MQIMMKIVNFFIWPALIQQLLAHSTRLNIVLVVWAMADAATAIARQNDNHSVNMLQMSFFTWLDCLGMYKYTTTTRYMIVVQMVKGDCVSNT